MAARLIMKKILLSCRDVSVLYSYSIGIIYVPDL